jgi:hypothetical protein
MEKLTDELDALISKLKDATDFKDKLNGLIRKVCSNTPPQICALALFAANLFAPMRRGCSFWLFLTNSF